MGKALVYLSIVISLATAGLGFVNKSKLKQANADAASANRLYADAKSAIDAAKNEIKSARASADTAKSLIDGANAEKAAAVKKASEQEAAARKAQDEAVDLQAKIQQKDAEIAKLKTERQQAIAQAALASLSPATPAPSPTTASAQANAQKKPAADKTATPAPAAQDVNRLLAEKDAAIRALQAQLAAKKPSGAVVSSSPLGLNGRILSVNEPWKLAVIDIGSSHGVMRNAELSVLDREDVSKPVGLLRVTLVEPNSSIVEIVETTSGSIAPGDFAVSR